ncbi:dihydroxy-acid dehydratase [Actinomadura welshii]|uniref:dihydroxy-acid dehydratase n=1 Tax=Actinomadura welshii TaxID=3103817 RepID=UPI0004206BC4|nr:dihydroxy-acid dehydratase [Actinomadura madurae]
MVLRSSRWFARDDEVGLEHRAAMRAAGRPVSRHEDRPVIGILNSTSDLNPCNLPLRGLATAVRSAVETAGGIAVELPTISLGEDLMKPTAMLYRNLMAMEVEETIRAHPLDGVVLLGNCDKTIPAQLMGAASANLPALQLSGGYRRTGRFHGAEVGAGTDLWKYWEERRNGRIDDRDWQGLEAALGCSQGACNVMGTALTMSMMAEVLGMMVPGASTLPFDDPRLEAKAGETGSLIVEMVRRGAAPDQVLTPDSFRNALMALAAVGGSTNAVIHLCALAGRRMIPLGLEEFDKAAAATPVLADVAPIGRHTIAAFDRAGGIQAVLANLRRHRSGLPGDGAQGDRAIRTVDDPVTDSPALVVLRGNLAPDGAVLKTAAASRRLVRHTGPAVVFHGHADMMRRIDDPGLGATADSVLVLTGCGPRGGDGFPEWGMIPIPRRLAAEGVTDMVRVSDARMSGTSFGTCVLHVAPEAAAGGPLAAVRDGDIVTLDVSRRLLEVDLPPEVVAERIAAREPQPIRHHRGWPALYQEHVLQAPEGADFDFLVPRTAEALPFVDPVVGRS